MWARSIHNISQPIHSPGCGPKTTVPPSDRVRLWAILPLTFIPPLVAIFWGGPYNDAAYAQFLIARSLPVGAIPHTSAPLHTLLLALALWTGAPVAVAVGISVLGWAIAVGAWWRVGQVMGYPALGLVAAMLLALHPLQGQSLGLKTGLILGLFSLSALWAIQGSLILLLTTTVITGLLSPIGLLFLIPPWLWLGLRQGSRLSPATFILALALGAIPYGVLGSLSDPGSPVLLIATGEILFAAVVALVFARRDGFRGKPATLYRGMSLLVLVALLLGQAGWLWQDGRLRPTDRLTTYREAARLVQEQTLPDETVLTAYAGLVGYLSERHTISLPDDASSEDILITLERSQPDYCLVPKTLPWHLAISHPWFRERYHLVQIVLNPRDLTGPLSLFRYIPSPFDAGDVVTPTLTFAPEADRRLELVAYRLDHRRLTPGESRYLTLYWRTETGLQHPLRVVLRLTEQATGKTWLRMERDTPSGLRMDFWPSGQIQQDRYVLAPPADLPPGDYDLALTLLLPNGRNVSPIAGTDDEAGVPFPLVHLYRPQTVSAAPPTPDYPIRFRLGDAIELVGYDAPEWIAPGETFRVALYWHALLPISADYKVFVHLLTPEGILLAQSDRVPVNWTSPTSRWQIGEYIMDEHWLTLDASAPRGDAWLSTGMYDAITGDRVSAFADTGRELPEKRIVLREVRVR